MKKSFFGLIILLILLTTYNPKFSSLVNFKINIQDIIVENNVVLEKSEIQEQLAFLYNNNLFFLNLNSVEENLKKISFIDSFSIKKIYPNKLKLVIKEKTPIAILQNKKKKFYISDTGSLINFREIEAYKDLVTVFGNSKNFYPIYKDLLRLNFPLEKIKSYYFFESGRCDLIMFDKKVIKLPIKNYISSLENFMSYINSNNFNKYKIYDYRIKNQLILN